MKVHIKIHGQALSVEVPVEVYKYLDRADHKTENLFHEQRRHWDGREFDEYIVAHECSRSYNETPEDLLCRKETLREILTALEICTKIQRQRFLLFALEGFSCTQIGNICGCSKYAVWDSIKTVRKKCKKILKTQLQEL
jgi:RNA polymerase sigma-70 factor (ECF subfamily)